MLNEKTNPNTDVPAARPGGTPEGAPAFTAGEPADGAPLTDDAMAQAAGGFAQVKPPHRK